MNRRCSRCWTAFTAIAAISVLAAFFMAAAPVSAAESTLTRADVLAELAEARAQGTLDHAGELATTDAVLQARDWANATQTRVLSARLDVQRQQQQPNHGADGDTEVATYTEAGADGQPVMVVLVMRADGSITNVHSVQLASLR